MGLLFHSPFNKNIFQKLEFTEEGTLSYEDIPDGTDESGFDISTDLLEKVISEVPF